MLFYLIVCRTHLKLKTEVMNFEQLANEILLDMFEYLKSIHLLRAFSHLNSRFNNLLIIHFRTHGLDFQSIFASDFDIICQQHLPLLADRITALRLSDDDDTPNQIDLFLSDYFPRYQFIQLKSLILYHISSIGIIKKVVLQFRHLPLLAHFILIDCHVKSDNKTLRNIINRIWNLRKLTHCHFDLNLSRSCDFCIPTIRSQVIEHLHIGKSTLDVIQLTQLFRCTPNLRHLYTQIDEFPNDTQFPSAMQSISILKLVVNHLTNGTINLLKAVPNLIVLTLQTGKHHMHGHKWKQLIIDYLPKLKIFQFQMLFFVNNEEEMQEIFDSYRTSFWIIERQWFVRCHWKLENTQVWILLYTLPYAFSSYSYLTENSNGSNKSTCPNENDYSSYNRVITLRQSYLTLNDPFVSHIRFHNIRHLEMTIPFSDRFLSVLPRLDQLTSLDVSSDSEGDADLALSQLQSLIDLAPRLYFLSISHWNSSIIQNLPLNLTSNSIRRLDMQSHHYLKRDRCFNRAQCAAFLRSPLAQQCEVLQIVVNDRSIIDDLINRMASLQALKVVFQTGDWDNHYPSQAEMIIWMTSLYSRTFTENLFGTETIRLWIRK